MNFSIEVLNGEEVTKTLDQLERAVTVTSPQLSEISKVMLTSVQTNFAVSGRPPWKPLKPATIKSKGGGKPLIRTGRMFRSLQARTNQDAASVSTNVPYAVYQNATRPFMVIQEEDAEAFQSVLLKPIDEALR